MTGDMWHRLAGEVEQLDAHAGRALHVALREHASPLRIQVAGRAGTGRRAIARAVVAAAGPSPVEVVVTVVDAPDTIDPVLGADVVVYVLPSRLDPADVHPADRTALSRVDPRRVVVVVTGAGGPVDPVAATLGTGVFTAGDPALDDAIAARRDTAHLRRDEDLARIVAGIATTPAARDLIEAALDSVAVRA